jgi:hypothetical protein
MKHFLAATALALTLAACSSDPADPAGNNALVVTDLEERAPGMTGTDTATPTPSPPPIEGPPTTPSPVPSPPTANAQTLTLEGLGPLRIGQPVPANSGFAQRGAQVSDACTTVSSPAYPGVYAIVERGAVRRITAGQRSTVQLVEGIGVGATEKQVMADFAGFRATPHKYVEAPAKYLTAPNADSGDSALRFEIGRDGKVSLIHIGTMPTLGYVEGCA